MEKEDGKIIVPNEKCKIFHQTTVTLGRMTYHMNENGGDKGLPRRMCPCLLRLWRQAVTAGLRVPSGGSRAHYIECGKSTELQNSHSRHSSTCWPFLIYCATSRPVSQHVKDPLCYNIFIVPIIPTPTLARSHVLNKTIIPSPLTPTSLPISNYLSKRCSPRVPFSSDM